MKTADALSAKTAERKPGQNCQRRQYGWPTSIGTPWSSKAVIAVTRKECDSSPASFSRCLTSSQIRSVPRVFAVSFRLRPLLSEPHLALTGEPVNDLCLK